MELELARSASREVRNSDFWIVRAAKLNCTSGSGRSYMRKRSWVIRKPNDLCNGLLGSSQLLALLTFGLLPISNASVGLTPPR